MKRAYLNFVIDAAAAFLFLGMLATGFILRFPLPPGTQRSLILWGLSRHEWGTVHTWISFGLIAVLLVHVALHWQWISGIIRNRIRRKSLNGAGGKPQPWKSGLVVAALLLGVFSAFAWAAHRGVQPLDTPQEPQREQLRSRGGFTTGGAAHESTAEIDPGSTPDIENDLESFFAEQVYPDVAKVPEVRLARLRQNPRSALGNPGISDAVISPTDNLRPGFANQCVVVRHLKSYTRNQGKCASAGPGCDEQMRSNQTRLIHRTTRHEPGNRLSRSQTETSDPPRRVSPG